MATQTAISSSPAAAAAAAPVLRRSTTLPTKLQRPLVTTSTASTTTLTNDAPVADPNDAAETLFTHPAARIVCFSASPNSYKPRTTNTRSATSQLGLPWSSKAERVVAVGELRCAQPRGSLASRSGRQRLTSLPMQDLSASTACAAPSASCTRARCSSPCCLARNAGASTATPPSPCASSPSSTASSSPTPPQKTLPASPTSAPS